MIDEFPERLLEVDGIGKKKYESIIEDFLNSLSFKLTEDQISTIYDILNDMKKDVRMNRLVLGDVGSGKTIVAIVAILANYLSGYQSTFMAPTEILAKQHYQSIKNYFSEYNINIVLLTGSLTKKSKEKLYSDIELGNADIVIGTHALLNEKMSFNNLGLVITDEQHRFGVNQRNLLQNKGTNGEADVIYLSATPIPRTYALTIYGDMDVSIIKEMPKGRLPVKTKVFNAKEMNSVYKLMEEELINKHQIYVIAPLIEENEELDLTNVNTLRDKMNLIFGNKYRIDIVHGKMKAKEKDLIMEEFKHNIVNILISTTVIEVGVDVSNATMMVIFDANRFGLSTLHQLRGRVGRGADQSYCILVTGFKLAEDTRKRIEIMVRTNDGFEIAEADLKLRGPGDLEGTQQSGMAFDLKIADLAHDGQILQLARDVAEKIIEEDPTCELPKYELLWRQLKNLRKTNINWSAIS